MVLACRALCFSLFQDFRLPLDEDVGRLEAILDVHAQLALREVPDVAVRRAHLVARSQVLPMVRALAGDSTMTRFRPRFLRAPWSGTRVVNPSSSDRSLGSGRLHLALPRALLARACPSGGRGSPTRVPDQGARRKARTKPGHRGVTRQGPHHREVPGTGLRGARVDGHVRDLPKSKLGVDIENGFQPSYILIKGKAKILKELKQSARQASTIYWRRILTAKGRRSPGTCRDPGERIRRPHPASGLLRDHQAGHPLALETPRSIDMKQGARAAGAPRARPPGGVSGEPLLWKTVRYGLSAGRVQSVACA